MPAATVGTPSMGHQSKIWVVESFTFNETTAQCLDFQSESIQQSTALFYNDGIRGTRSRARERVREAAQTISGTITMTPSKTELRTLLPWILGTNETGSGTSGTPYAYTLAETMQTFQMLVYRSTVSGHTDAVFLYEGCTVSRATFSASTAGPLQLALDIEAKTEKTFANGSISTAYNGSTQVMSGGASGRSVPTSVPDNDTCFMFHDTGNSSGILTLGGTNREAFDWSLTIDNVLDTGRYMNNIVRTSIPTMDRVITMSATVPFSEAEDHLYFSGRALSDSPVNATSPDMHDDGIRFYAEMGTNDDVLLFTTGTWNVEPRTPTVNGKGEIVLPLAGTLYRKNSATAQDELSVSIWTT